MGPGCLLGLPLRTPHGMEQEFASAFGSLLYLVLAKLFTHYVVISSQVLAAQLWATPTRLLAGCVMRKPDRFPACLCLTASNTVQGCAPRYTAESQLYMADGCSWHSTDRPCTCRNLV